MDKEMIKEAYRSGSRAYIRDGYNVIGTTVLGKMVTYQEVLSSDMDIWHALRAYQDEQRKKGKNIELTLTNSDATKWLAMSVPNGYRFSYILLNKRPIIQLSVPGETYAGLPVYKTVFTNFRWREGYPKENKI